MTKVYRKSELAVRFEDTPGALGRLLDLVAHAGVDLLAYNAFNDFHGPMVLLVSDDCLRTKAALERGGYRCRVGEVLMVEAPDRVGIAARLGQLLGQAGVNILYSYASASSGARGYAIFKTSDDEGAAQILRSARDTPSRAGDGVPPTGFPRDRAPRKGETGRQGGPERKRAA